MHMHFMTPEQPRYFRPLVNRPSQYTYMDCFCGCGGTSAGAVLAGLLPVYAFDHDEAALQSYARAFNPGILKFQQNVVDFVKFMRESIEANGLTGVQVDVCHLSPPCQFFSPAHTTSGKQDAANHDASFCIEEILELFRLRVATMEQTFGLKTHHPGKMVAILRQFLSKGFTITWSIVHLADYGVPQTRRRLILIATA